jgi:hypothetical protein
MPTEIQPDTLVAAETAAANTQLRRGALTLLDGIGLPRYVGDLPLMTHNP